MTLVIVFQASRSQCGGAKVASMETKMRSLELELGAVKLVNREKYKTLNCKVEQMKKRQSDILH